MLFFVRGFRFVLLRRFSLLSFEKIVQNVSFFKKRSELFEIVALEF